MFIGFVADNSRLQTKGGYATLTTAKVGESITPYHQALERSGLLVLVSGVLHNKVIHEAVIVEVTPMLISTMVKIAMERHSITWTQLELSISAARNIVIGDIHEVPEIVETDTSSPKPKPRLVIDVGHRKKAPGACSKKFDICEFALNSEIAELVKAKVTKAEVVITSRAHNNDGQSALAAKINALSPHFIVSLHANGSEKPTSEGTEMLHFHTSSKSKQMAGIYQKHVLSALGFRDRGLKPTTSTQNGGTLLQNTNAPCVLTEPFFLTNERETKFVLENKNKLVDAYVKAIHEIVDTMF